MIPLQTKALAHPLTCPQPPHNGGASDPAGAFIVWAQHYFRQVLADPTPAQLVRARGVVLSAYTAHRASVDRHNQGAERTLAALDDGCTAAFAVLRCLELRAAPASSPHEVAMRRGS